MALLTFSGKTLCVSMALNPKDYEGTKYIGEDRSDKKVYEATPFTVRLTSDRKVKQVKELLAVLFNNAGETKGEAVAVDDVKLPKWGIKKLINENLIKEVEVKENSDFFAKKAEN